MTIEISIHALLAESDCTPCRVPPGCSRFQSTLSSRRATYAIDSYYAMRVISIHALLAESDPARRYLRTAAIDISIHALLAESDPLLHRCTADLFHFNPRSPRGERHDRLVSSLVQVKISIHALLAESDPIYANRRRADCISIHALLAESDEKADAAESNGGAFQSTLSSRRATESCRRACIAGADFNPRSPRGERRRKIIKTEKVGYFNPRSPRGERRGTSDISGRADADFNPRSPRGERLKKVRRTRWQMRFQSTLSSRRATSQSMDAPRIYMISIHALLAESDCESLAPQSCFGLFQSTLSSRRATWFCAACEAANSNFNPRSPRGERHVCQIAPPS